MNFRKEKDLQEKVREEIIKRYGTNVWYYHPRTRVQKGVPDIILCFFGTFIAIELKKDLKKYDVTKLQKYNLDKIKKANGCTIISSNVQEVICFLDYMCRGFIKLPENKILSEISKGV